MNKFFKQKKAKLLVVILTIMLILGIASIVNATGLPEVQDGAITLTEDVTLDEDVTAKIVVPSGKTVTLDLNGHTITAISKQVAITNEGNLTIKGEGNVIADSNYAVLNHGELLTIKGGNYSKTDSSATQSLISNGWYTNSDNTSGAMSQMIINGGIFDGGAYTAVKNDSFGVMTINGGTFTSTNSTAGIQETGNGITINGGTFDAVVYVQNYTSVDGVSKEAHFNGGTFNKAVKCEAGNTSSPQASNVKVFIEEKAEFNNNLSISNSSAKTGTIPFAVEKFDVKNIGGSLTFAGKNADCKLPALNLDGLTTGGALILNYVEKSTISNTTVKGADIKAGDVVLKNVNAKMFTNNTKNAVATFGEGTKITTIKETLNSGNSIVIDGATIDSIVNTGKTKMYGFESITIKNGNVGTIDTSKGDIEITGGKVEKITIVDKFVTANPVNVTVSDGAFVDVIDNQREGDDNATVETNINLPENCTISDEGKVLINISSTTVSDVEEKYTYTGENIAPELTIKYENEKLEKDTDYTVEYKDNKEIGKATIVITGKGKYTGTKEIQFNIEKATYDMSNVKFEDLTVAYDGKSHLITATGLPVLKYVSSNIGKNESKLLRVCAVDLGVDNDAVCSIIKYDGTVTARKFIRFAVEKDRMYKILEQIKKNQQNGNLRTPRLWRFVDNYNQAISTKTATEIIDFALLYSAQVIVMEHLEFKGKKSGSKKQRLHLWRKKEILNRVTDLAHKYNMRVSTVNPRNTSKLAYDGSGFVMRGINGKYSVCMFMTGKIYNCDLSASYNIGARYLIREFLKTVSSNIEEQLRAKVPEAFKRTLCTLSTLISLRATAESLGLVC